MSNVDKAVELIIEEARRRPLPEDKDIVRAIYSVFMDVGVELNNIFNNMREDERINKTKYIDLVPDSFTTREGGTVWDWKNHHTVNSRDLEVRDSLYVSLYGIEVHSLMFNETEHNPPKRWDCVNGWN